MIITRGRGTTTSVASNMSTSATNWGMKVLSYALRHQLLSRAVLSWAISRCSTTAMRITVQLGRRGVVLAALQCSRIGFNLYSDKAKRQDYAHCSQDLRDIK